MFHIEPVLNTLYATCKTAKGQLVYSGGDLKCNKGKGHCFIEGFCCLCDCPFDSGNAGKAMLLHDALHEADLKEETKLSIELHLRQPFSSKRRLSEAHEWSNGILWQPWGKAQIDKILTAFVCMYPDSVKE
jgi:hypothetical protein